MKSSFIPGSAVMDLLCRLFSAYRGGLDTKPLLHALRGELGETEFANLQSDLARLMKKMPAWKAVTEVIGQAAERKKALLAGNRAGNMKPRGLYGPAEFFWKR